MQRALDVFGSRLQMTPISRKALLESISENVVTKFLISTTASILCCGANKGDSIQLIVNYGEESVLFVADGSEDFVMFSQNVWIYLVAFTRRLKLKYFFLCNLCYSLLICITNTQKRGSYSGRYFSNNKASCTFGH